MSESDRANNNVSRAFPFSNFDHEQNPFDSSVASFSDYLHGGAVEYNSLAAAFDLHHSNNNQDSRESRIHGNLRFSPTKIRVEEEEDSSANANDDQDQEQDHIKPNNLSCKVVKKKGSKKERETRFAFKTKSEIDNLEDGYRWRKYGQKAVKNSPFPRSYYRCTSLECGVKKRIERSFEEPSMVITTYEGQHNHHTPATRTSMLPPASSYHTLAHQNYLLPSTVDIHHRQMNQYPINPSYYARVVHPQLEGNPNPNANQYMQMPNMLSSYIHRPQP